MYTDVELSAVHGVRPDGQVRSGSARQTPDVRKRCGLAKGAPGASEILCELVGRLTPTVHGWWRDPRGRRVGVVPALREHGGEDSSLVCRLTASVSVLSSEFCCTPILVAFSVAKRAVQPLGMEPLFFHRPDAYRRPSSQLLDLVE